MKTICIGDSITRGYGVSGSENWVELLRSETGLDFVNRGVNGDTTGGMLSRFCRDVVEGKPRYAVIMGGTNDLISENSFGSVKSNIMAMVNQSYHSGITPILGISIKADISSFREDWARLTDVDHLNYKILEYRKWLLEFCSVFNVSCVDFYSGFEKKTGSACGAYLIDGLHPTKEGHRILADIALERFSSLGINSKR